MEGQPGPYASPTAAVAHSQLAVPLRRNRKKPASELKRSKREGDKPAVTGAEKEKAPVARVLGRVNATEARGGHSRAADPFQHLTAVITAERR